MTVALVTGGAGFIGSGLVRHLVLDLGWQVVTVDKLTYAGRMENLISVLDHPNHRFVRADIADRGAMRRAFADARPNVVFHLAAESHVDRSIDSPAEFIETNIVGSYVLIETALERWRSLEGATKENFRFVHVSTDEVYGSLPPGAKFSETSPFQPNSPYAASKAAADLLVRAWHRTYGFPGIITNCSNNYGPRQYPEKLIPLLILNLAEGRKLPVYGDGGQERDWLHVEDHARALVRIAGAGRIGETYCIGGESECANLDLVRKLCALFDEIHPEAPWRPHASLIAHVADRPGHDRRYATDIARIKTELGWRPQWTLDDGLRATVAWYLANRTWCTTIAEGQAARGRRGVGS